MNGGATLVTPQFLSLTGDNVSISSLAPTGSDVFGTVTIKTIDRFGFSVDSYTWTNEGGDNEDEIGWQDNNNYAMVNNITFGPGSSLWVDGASTSQALQASGKVSLSEISIKLRSGATLAGNPYPVDITLGDILPSGEDVFGNITIQLIDEFGFSIASYTWTNEGGDNEDETGWQDNNNYAMVNAVIISAGTGFWVDASLDDAQYITLCPKANL